MDQLADSPTLVALRTARGLLQEASLETLAVRRRVAGLADATHWRSRATAAYTAGVARLADDLAALAGLIDATDVELAAAQRDEAARVTALVAPQW